MRLKHVTSPWITSLLLIFASSSPAAAQQTTLVSCPTSVTAFFFSRAFYLESYPGTSLSTVQVSYDASTVGTYTVRLTARSGTYDGPVIGTADATVTLSSSSALVTATFDFGNVTVTQGSIVTFSQSLVSGPTSSLIAGLRLRGSVTACSGVKLTTGADAPLSTALSGSAGLTVTGTGLTGTGGTVTVPPTLSGLPQALTIDEDAATSALSFTVADLETSATNLMVTGRSSNVTLVPHENVVFGGTGSNRTVTITPATNQYGQVTISVTVTDENGGYDSDNLILTITNVNDAPGISGPANQTTSPGVAVGPLSVTLTDIDTTLSQLTLSGASSNTAVVPTANITFGGSGGARTVTVAPAAGVVGTSTITLTVSDGVLTASTSFTVTTQTTLTLEKTGAGIGTVGTTTDPRRCGTSCTQTYTSADTITLVALPEPQAAFAGWTGDDDCLDGVVTMSANRTCRARFTQLPAGAGLDLNGDGTADVFSYDSSTGNWTDSLGTAARGFTASATGGWSPRWVIRAADFNLDTRADLFLYNPNDGTWFQVLKTESSYQYINGTWTTGWSPVVADFNHDRRSDVFLYNPLDGAWLIAFASASGGWTYSAAGQWSPGWEVYPVEYNADSYGDLFLYNPSTGQWFWVVNNGQGPGIGSANPYIAGTWAADWHVVPADLTADGRTDFVLYNRTTGAWMQARSTASGSFETSSGTWPTGASIHSGDFNGDGRDDIFLYNETSGAWTEALIDASGVFTTFTGTWDAGWRVLPGPIVADNRRTLFLYAPATGTYVSVTPTTPGSFSFTSGSFASGLSLVTASARH